MGLEINEAPQPNGRGRKARTAPTVSEQIKADANRIEYATDSMGRSIGVRKLNALDMFELTLALGGEVSSNQSALMQALSVSSVCEIDGDPVSRPGSLLQIKALMKRLDFHGIQAASEALSRFNAESSAEIESAKN